MPSPFSRGRCAAVPLVVAAVLAWASVVDGASRDHDIEIDDYFTLGTITALAVAPDGRSVAYIESRWEDGSEKTNADLWVVDVATQARRRLTFDAANEAAPQWSPDGRHIYFTARVRRNDEGAPHNGKKQVWRIAPDGTDLQVTRVPGGIGTYELSTDGRCIYHTVAVENSAGESSAGGWESLRARFRSLEYGQGPTRFTQIWRLDLESWRSEKLIDEHRVVTEMAIAHDQSRIAMVTAPDDEVFHVEGWSRVDVWEAATGATRTVTPDAWRDDHPSPYGAIKAPCWSDDGCLAFAVVFDGHPCRIYACDWERGEPRVTELRRPEGVSVDPATLAWREQSRDLCFVGEERARARVCAVTDVRAGSRGVARVLTPGDHSVSAFDFDGSGTLLGVTDTTLTDPRDIYAGRVGEPLQRVTKVNPHVDRWKLPRISLVSWRAPDGRDVEGILELPPDARPGERLPLVVQLHGGPTASVRLQFQFLIYGRTLLPAKGYALLCPNYRGSTGYGDDFIEDLIGRENDVEVADILSGVDAMVERGIADPDRLGVMGWSNGGFLATCIVTRTDRFKAASSGAGVIDQVIQWGLGDTPGHVLNFVKGAFPWDRPEAYLAASPLSRLNSVRTPMLIHTGEFDARVPAAHSRALHRALTSYVGVPAELVVYPGAKHELAMRSHCHAKLAWDLAWFDHHIRGKQAGVPAPPAAPAAAALPMDPNGRSAPRSEPISSP